MEYNIAIGIGNWNWEFDYVFDAMHLLIVWYILFLPLTILLLASKSVRNTIDIDSIPEMMLGGLVIWALSPLLIFWPILWLCFVCGIKQTPNQTNHK